MWISLDFIQNLFTLNRKLFPTVAYAYASTPTYATGTIGFLICSLDDVSVFA
jgi:spermidine synthase